VDERHHGAILDCPGRKRRVWLLSALRAPILQKRQATSIYCGKC
jgi:hypothetical protein